MAIPGNNMTLAQARVIDPILTEHVRGYTNAGMVGMYLFPFVNMPTRAAKRIEFNRDSFRRVRTRRAPGTHITQYTFGYEGKPVALTQEALQAVTPLEYQEEAGAVPGINLQQEGVDTVLSVLALEREIQQAETARNALFYAPANKLALVGADKFSDPASDPLTVVSDAKENIRKRTGRRPNTMMLGATVAAALKKHPKIKEHYKHTDSSAVSDEMLARYFDIEHVYVGDAIYDLDELTTVDVWGNDVILAFVPPEGQRNMRLPGYGYTYRLQGSPFVEQVEWDKDIRSWTNNVFDEYSPELVGPDAGFLIQNAV